MSLIENSTSLKPGEVGVGITFQPLKVVTFVKSVTVEMTPPPCRLAKEKPSVGLEGFSQLVLIATKLREKAYASSAHVLLAVWQRP